MSYISRRPSGSLAGIVERVWRVEVADAAGVAETICPDGCAELVIHLGDPMEGQAEHLLVGQMVAPITVTPVGRVKMLGARFSPMGLHRVLPLPQERLVGHVVPLDAVWNAWTRRTADDVATAHRAEEALEVFERALEALIPEMTPHVDDEPVQRAVRMMRVRGGPLPLERFARAAGISRRQFERRFRDQVGLSPHLFGRIVRFQHAFAALSHESGASVAARLGFADQAHLIREVRRFSGGTPTLLADADGLTTFFANPGVR